MTKLAFCPAAIVGWFCLASVTPVHSETAWDGFYAGLNAGEAQNKTCNNWTLSGAVTDPALVTAFAQRTCPNNNTFIGGLQFGFNAQTHRLFLGLAADYDIWGDKNQSGSLKYPGPVPPAGTYAFSGRLNPNGFGVIGPRFGYAGDHWSPYLRVGGVITGGSHNSTLTYTPVGAVRPTASFSGGKNFTSFGWAAGGGFEFVLHGAWSIRAEYLHVDLGNGSNSTTSCSGSVSACAEFSGISLDSTRNAFTADIVRIGFNYWFSY
jgi:outer membrane immunogenic protein